MKEKVQKHETSFISVGLRLKITLIYGFKHHKIISPIFLIIFLKTEMFLQAFLCSSDKHTLPNDNTKKCNSKTMVENYT